MTTTTAPAGTYGLHLALPDPVAALSTDPAYAIRLANSNMQWSGSGYHSLSAQIQVAPAGWSPSRGSGSGSARSAASRRARRGGIPRGVAATSAETEMLARSPCSLSHLSQASAGVAGQIRPGKLFGATLAEPPGIRDGYIVGAPGARINGQPAASAVIVNVPGVAPQELHQDSLSVPGTAGRGDRFAALPGP